MTKPLGQQSMGRFTESEFIPLPPLAEPRANVQKLGGRKLGAARIGPFSASNCHSAVRSPVSGSFLAQPMSNPHLPLPKIDE